MRSTERLTGVDVALSSQDEKLLLPSFLRVLALFCLPGLVSDPSARTTFFRLSLMMSFGFSVSRGFGLCLLFLFGFGTRFCAADSILRTSFSSSAGPGWNVYPVNVSNTGGAWTQYYYSPLVPSTASITNISIITTYSATANVTSARSLMFPIACVRCAMDGANLAAHLALLL